MPYVNEDLPQVKILNYQPWPERTRGYETVEFRLVYRGHLPAQGAGTGGSRKEVKHAIRRELHKQLRELWHTQVVLRRYLTTTSHTRKLVVPDLRDDETQQTTALDWIMKDYCKFGFRFVPLVNHQNGIACALDILFLRRDAPGNLIESGGDIDNRIKVLFDGLRLPLYNSEVEDFKAQDDENPFFVLLEDDKLITEVKVTTDRLLTPQETDESIHDVHLIIHVVTKIVDPQKAWPDFCF